MKYKGIMVFWAAYFLTTFFLVFEGPAYGAYTPPIGIPIPSFGIEENAPVAPPSWPGSATPGYYYIDIGHPNATDTGNINGYPNKPRLSIPTNLAAGSYVEIHSTNNIAYTGTSITINVSGTASNPVWVRGESPSSRPNIQVRIAISGSYAIFENLYIYRTDRDGAIGFSPGSNHISVRGCEMVGTGTNVGFGSVISPTGTPGNNVSHIVLYNNEIHAWGDESASVENDLHGVKPARNADYIWILNNHIHDLGGDSVQVGDASVPTADQPTYIYIGGNIFHDNMENAVDIKKSAHVIISQNTCYNYYAGPFSSGEGIVIHNGPDYVWAIYNKVYNCTIGIITTGSTNTYFIGNVIYNIHGSTPSDNFAGISHRGGGTLYVVNNTIYDVDTGIQVSSGVNPTIISNNIISFVTSSLYHVRVDDTVSAGGSDLTYTIMHNSDGMARIYWGSSPTRNLASFRTAFPNEGVGCSEADPLFENPSLGDFRVKTGSPAIDNGNANSSYTTFLNQYGINISMDPSRTPRPTGVNWDVGVYEYTGSAPPPTLVPGPPTNLVIS